MSHVSDYRDTYRTWSIPDSLWAHRPTTAPADLTELLGSLEPELARRTVRIVPSHFDGNHPDLRALPLPAAYAWRSCEQALRHFGSRYVMLRLPGFFQASSLVYACCKAVGAPLYPNEPDNLPIGLAAITAGSIDTVITTALDAGIYARTATEKELPLPRSWLIIHPLGTPLRLSEALASTSLMIAQEIHLFPCVPIFTQCAALMETRTSGFHLSDDFVLEEDGTSLLVSSKHRTDFPLFRYQIPRVVEPASPCSCGSITFAPRL